MANKRIDLLGALGGSAGLRTIIERFYDRLFSDMLIGFFFDGHDKTRLVASQVSYLLAHLGERDHAYRGPSIRSAHEGLPITTGHFDRRHQILREVLDEFAVDDQIRQSWLAFDQSLRGLIISKGSFAREALIETDAEGSPSGLRPEDEPGL
jgi:hemoglobin